MSKTTHRIKDNYGDALIVHKDGDGVVYLDASESNTGDFAFDPEQAQELVGALVDLAGLTNDVIPSGAVKASDVSLNEALIRVAAAHETHVTFRYAKSDTSPIEVRTFIPSSVKNMGDHVTFVGQDDDRDGYRSFRSDRIKGTVQVVA